jgi:hypothetical protein
MLPKIRKRQKPCGLWRSQDDFLAQWIKHRLDLPVDESASCPASCIFPPKPGCVSGLPLPRSLSPEPASETLGCPLASVLRLCRRWMLELPRTSHAFDAAGFSKAPSCLGGSCFPLPRLRCRTWVAPRPASPALPAMDHRVAPMLASFGGAELPILELPRESAFRYRRRFVVRVAPHVESSGTDRWISELPRITHLPVCLG